MIIGLHHVAISVPDLAAATAFYTEHLGFEVAFTGGWDGDEPDKDRAIGLDDIKAEMAMLRHSNAYLELWQYHRPQPVPRDPRYSPADHGLAHFSLQVSDIDAEHERLSAAGMTFHGPPVHLGPTSAIYGRDPWGTIIELHEPFGGGGIPGTDVA